ncbi:reticulon-like protein B8 isoform X2 [Malania oleifera]|uniref:reticulon-like protein B8 isoform X2 n=1 Tax=Malania oleifera TaxID=397392 RepID=UPI0025AE888B|nr:reticulon-like protein B8 isoform X2 [Malania oleifera]
MPEGVKAENLLNSLVETVADSVQKHKSVSFFEEEKNESVTSQFKRLFGRQKPVHNVLGGGKSADVLLWRNKKISASVLAGATAIWVLFEWLNYHFLTFSCIAVILGMLVQFLWSNASNVWNRAQSNVPRLIIPDELFVNIGISVGTEVNRALGFLQDVACRGTSKQFLMSISLSTEVPLKEASCFLVNYIFFLYNSYFLLKIITVS